eukprot:14204-Heterococcus_DN1.PRE.1
MYEAYKARKIAVCREHDHMLSAVYMHRYSWLVCVIVSLNTLGNVEAFLSPERKTNPSKATL